MYGVLNRRILHAVFEQTFRQFPLHYNGHVSVPEKLLEISSETQIITNSFSVFVVNA
jgi:hypothetical protein